VPVVPSTAYVTLETVTTLIRAICNDMLYSPAGEILTDEAYFMLPLLNDALEWMTNELNNHGVETFVQETILTPLTPTPGEASTDPGTQANISDYGYFDGVGINMGPQLQLPTNLLQPDFLWERQTGSQETWIPMTLVLGGMPSITPGSRFGMWEWRQDAIYLPGITQSEDIRLRMITTLPMFVSVNDTLNFRGAVGTLAYKMVSTYLASKNPAASQAAGSEATVRLNQLATRSSRMKQRTTITRRPYGSGGGGRRFFPPVNS
jgi:hypothetical protein